MYVNFFYIIYIYILKQHNNKICYLYINVCTRVNFSYKIKTTRNYKEQTLRSNT